MGVLDAPLFYLKGRVRADFLGIVDSPLASSYELHALVQSGAIRRPAGTKKDLKPLSIRDNLSPSVPLNERPFFFELVTFHFRSLNRGFEQSIEFTRFTHTRHNHADQRRKGAVPLAARGPRHRRRRLLSRPGTHPLAPLPSHPVSRACSDRKETRSDAHTHRPRRVSTPARRPSSRLASSTSSATSWATRSTATSPSTTTTTSSLPRPMTPPTAT